MKRLAVLLLVFGFLLVGCTFPQTSMHSASCVLDPEQQNLPESDVYLYRSEGAAAPIVLKNFKTISGSCEFTDAREGVCANVQVFGETIILHSVSQDNNTLSTEDISSLDIATLLIEDTYVCKRNASDSVPFSIDLPTGSPLFTGVRAKTGSVN